MTLIDTALVVFIVAAVLHSVFLVASCILIYMLVRRARQSLERIDDLTAKGSATIQIVHDFVSSITVRIESMTRILSLAGLERLYKQYKQTRKESQ